MTLYVLCPSGATGSGPESLHQLVHHARRHGIDAHVYYFGDEQTSVPHAFRNYDCPVAYEITDLETDVVVIPETNPELSRSLSRARKVLWWLSVDGFRQAGILAARAEGSAYGRMPFDFVYDRDSGIVHLAQTEYARLHLALQGVDALSLGGYVNSTTLDRYRAFRGKPKKDRVAYVAQPGSRFAPALVEASYDRFKWVPVADLGEDEAVEVIGTSKVFVDLSPHGGMPILPMYAATAGCAIIAGTRGAAANGVDLPLRRRYLVNEAMPDAMTRILFLVSDMLADFRSFSSDFTRYARWAGEHEDVFGQQVGVLRSLFDPAGSAAVATA